MEMDDIQNLLGGDGLQKLMQQAQQMQAKMQEAKANAASKTVVGEAGGGMVKVTANGAQQITRVELDPIVVDASEMDMLQDLITAATNVALTKAREMIEAEMGPMGAALKAAGMG